VLFRAKGFLRFEKAPTVLGLLNMVDSRSGLLFASSWF